ncbi:MAG: transcription termination/antitermination protein NusG [Patescibacteria group bacterium]|nr:transcription termination/antitermination protein NusG [Patescibacteria group bacterium]
MGILGNNNRQKLDRGRNWYVVHTYSGYEDAVRRSLLHRIGSLGMEEIIFDVLVPTYTDVEMKKTKTGVEKKETKKRLFPGYILVDMIVTDESWYIVRNTPHVTGFVGAGNTPVPVSPEEYERLVGKSDAPNKEKFKIDLEEHDLVVVLEGPFAGHDAVVSEIDDEKGKVKVLISVFGRETPMELDHDQLEKK